jgi:hypothetical protein
MKINLKVLAQQFIEERSKPSYRTNDKIKVDNSIKNKVKEMSMLTNMTEEEILLESEKQQRLIVIKYQSPEYNELSTEEKVLWLQLKHKKIKPLNTIKKVNTSNNSNSESIGIGEFVYNILDNEGLLSSQEILDRVLSKYPEANTKLASINWYKNKWKNNN